MTDPTLAALLAEAAALLEGTEMVSTAPTSQGVPAGQLGQGTPTGQGSDYYLDRVLFASLAGVAAEFRLRDEVGAAALRTPDVTSSARGAGWVRFAPKQLDAHARDRARAWLESAWRRADAELSGISGVDGAVGHANGADDADAADLDDE